MSTTVTPIFPCRSEYSVRIPEIDAQHQQLVGLINELHAAMSAGNGKQALSHILDELVRYTEGHFSYEETMLERRGYSALAAHRAEHQRLKQQVYELRDKVKSGQTAVTIPVMQF